MKVKLKKNTDKKSVYDITELISSLTYSGTQVQASRRIDFSLAFSPFDDEFPNIDIQNGDKIYFNDGDEKFVGRVVRTENPSSPGVRSFSALDFMNLLLKSKRSYNFKNMTAEAITKKVIRDAGLEAGEIAKTKVNIKKWIIEGETPYNIILGAYQKAHRQNGKKYRICMDGVKVCVKEMNEKSGVKLTDRDSVISALISRDAENIVNRVYILDDKNKTVGKVEDKGSIKLFGLYTDTYKKEDGVNAKKAAKALLKGIKKEIGPLEAVGDIRAVSGKSIEISEEVSGLCAKCFITEDSHTYENGQHTMSLKLSLEKNNGRL